MMRTTGRILSAALSIALVVSLCPLPAAASTLQIAELQPQAVKSASKTTKTRASYKIKTYKTTKTYGNVTAKYSVAKPVIKGTSKIVDKINSSLNSSYKKRAAVKSSFFEIAYGSRDWGFGKVVFRDIRTAKATYNARGIVSFKYSSEWYAGGRINIDDTGVAFSLKTGKELTLSDVMSGSASQIKKKVAAKLEPSVRGSFKEKKLSDISFYLSGGNVIVCFECYELDQGNRPITVTLKGDYA